MGKCYFALTNKDKNAFIMKVNKAVTNFSDGFLNFIELDIKDSKLSSQNYCYFEDILKENGINASIAYMRMLQSNIIDNPILYIRSDFNDTLDDEYSWVDCETNFTEDNGVFSKETIKIGKFLKRYLAFN